jgi:hypothetical protein
MPKQITITRKIQLRINTTDKTAIADYRRQLEVWRDICVKIANMGVTQLYVNLMGDSLSFMREKTKAELLRPENIDGLTKKEQRDLVQKENRLVYDLIEQERKEHGMTPELSYFYNLLATHYKTSIRTAVISALSTNLLANFNSEKKEYLLHQRSLRTYKQNMPIPITSQSIRSVGRSVDDTGKEYKDFAFNVFGIPLRTHLGKDLSNNRQLLEQAFSAWFLPDAIWNIETALSDAIMALRLNRSDLNCKSNIAEVGGIQMCISYRQMDKEPMRGARLNEGRHRYEFTCAIKEREYQFFMGPKEAKKTADNSAFIPGYKIISNVKLSDSGLQVITERIQDDTGKFVVQTKFFWLATFKIEPKVWDLDPEKTAYCELGIETPIIVKIGSRTINIGSKDDYLNQRLAIQGARSRTQRDLRGVGGGHGRKKKLKPLGRYKKYEKNTVNNKLHNYTSELIKICLKYRVKNILLVQQKEKEARAKEDKILLRNWGYHGTKFMIDYKAAREGMIVSEE